MKTSPSPTSKRHFETVDDCQPGPWLDLYNRLVSLLNSGFLLGIHGTRGTGKTQIAICLIHLMRSRRQSNRYTTAFKLLNDIQSSFKSDVLSQKAIIEKYTHPDILIIDEFQVRGESDWEDRMFSSIVDDRYFNRKDTLIISNHKAKEFTDSLGSSIASRMQECGGLILCDWPSFRNNGPTTA